MLNFKVATFLFAIVSLVGGGNGAFADTAAQPPASISENDIAGMNADQLFGHSAVSSNNISAFTKWADALKREEGIKETTEVKEWRAFLDTLRDKSREEQIAGVNDYLNRLPYLTDMENYGTVDYWATIDQFLARGGDCEDYSLAKYFSLIELGFDANQMRLVILYDYDHRADHAVLAVTLNDKVDIMDNQFSSVREANSIASYKPIYAISQERWWRFL